MDCAETVATLAAFADHLEARRDALLQAWANAAETDPKLTTAATLSRIQFFDHIPSMLDALAAKLRATTLRDALDAAMDEAARADSHGLQRWQQGYNEQEVMREWVWLNSCLAQELELFASRHATVMAEAIASVAAVVSNFLVVGMSESVRQYAALQRGDAAARLAALEDAHRELASLEEQRARAWREAAHDLRGNVSIVQNLTCVIERASGLGAPPEQASIDMLHRSMDSLRALLDDLTAQARLDAGREQQQIAPFDASECLYELAAATRPIASQRGLYLHAVGPPALLVEGDRVKVCRIAQNLLLNAVQYTEQGGVKLTWEEAKPGGDRWMLSVEDTGPGLSGGAAAPLSHALDAATRDTQQLAQNASTNDIESDPTEKAAMLTSRSSPSGHPRGEGIGLAIVKRLCEVLDASLELQTEPGKGSTFRVTFPSRYVKG